MVSHNGDIMFLIIFDKILDTDNLRCKKPHEPEERLNVFFGYLWDQVKE